MRIPWPALLRSEASSTSAPQALPRVPARSTSFGRELAAALKQRTAVERDRDERGVTPEGAAIAIAVPLPDQVAALPGSKHDLHPPQRIESDVFVRIVAERAGVKTRLPPSAPRPPGVAGTPRGEAQASTGFVAADSDHRSRPVAEQSQPQPTRSSPVLAAPTPSMASPAQIPATPLVTNEAVVDATIEMPRADVDHRSARQRAARPLDRPLLDSNADEPRSAGQIPSRDVAAIVVHAGEQASLDIASPQLAPENASHTIVARAALTIATRSPATPRNAPAPVHAEAGAATPQALVDSTAQRSITSEACEDDTQHPPRADGSAIRHRDHVVGLTHQEKSAAPVRVLEPAERWPAPRAGAVDVPAVAAERVINQALDAASEIAIDELAQRKTLQPQRGSELLETRQPHSVNTQVDSGTRQGPASDSPSQGQDRAAPPATHAASVPATRVAAESGSHPALPPAAESASSASVSHAAVASNASQTVVAPSAAVPTHTVPLRADATPAVVPALIDQVVHRLLDAPPNGTVTLRLDPPELGTLLVRFQRRGSQLNITMTAEREDVSRLLRQGLGPLQSSLSQLQEQVSVQVDTHGESRGRGEEAALGSRRQRESESHQNEPARDQSTTSPREPNAQRAKRALRHARLDVWS